MNKHYILLYFLCFFTVTNSFAIEGISILASRTLLENEVAQKSIDDCLILLKKACQCEVEINDRSKEVLLILPDIDESNTPKSSFGKDLPYPYLDYPPHHYTWTSKRVNQQIHLELQSPTAQGISFGLYGLLQEQLWFAFHHPKQTIIPDLQFWPLTEDFTWKAQPRFDKKGFHLHTMHPLELTEPLLNPTCPDGIKQVKEYIDWLARNQQNYFEFNLLETDDLEAWVNYIKPAMNYAKSRGILIGVDISMHMTQQKAFMLYKGFPASLKSAKQQIKENLSTLFTISWDVIAMESSTTEFTQVNPQKIQELQLYVTDLVVNKHQAKLAGRAHVVKSEKLRSKSKETTALNPEEAALDANRAVFIHTVMFYGLKDKKAPVYENENLLHMLDLLKTDQQKRETWYYPESAYWITFDNSVPMLLTPYLQTRLDDILLMDSLGVQGHLTFSSGWEWGYWLIDWSIARWSWKHEFNGKNIKPRATQFLADIFHNPVIVDYINQLADLQQEYIKDKELIRYMTAQSAADEMPAPLDLEFQPRPEKRYSWWRHKANMDDLRILQKSAIEPLMKFSNLSTEILDAMKTEEYNLSKDQTAILLELHQALMITSLRAKHKAQTLAFLAAKRQAELDKKAPNNAEELLKEAQRTRVAAQELVKTQEKNYRYPLEYIARPIEGGGQTSYDFGYLYPVSNLHFWQREEEQIVQDKYGPFFMSIWDLPRILGVVD